MPKFELKDEEKKNDPREVAPKVMARFGPSLFVKGELSGNEDLVIEGQFHGKIDLGNNNLVVGQESELKANIQVRNITIYGDVEGNINASGKVFISKEGHVKGDISAPKISIMDGAQFRGSVKMEKEKKDTLSLKNKDKIEDKSPLKQTADSQPKGSADANQTD